MGARDRRATFVILAGVCIGGAALAPGQALAEEPGAQTQARAEHATEEIIVTGTRLRRAATGQDVHIYQRQRIEESGQSTVTDFLQTLPEVSLNSVESSFLATTVRLRGAILGSTLVLINGKRTQDVTAGASLAGVFDLNTIPLGMVERIEVLPTGSSAIYGGDALAGVVNIVLKSDFTGVTADVGYKFANDTDEQVYSGGAGWRSGPLSLSIMGSYSDRNPMFGRDRDITANPDYRRFGGPNLGNQFFGTPATVTSVSGNLPGLTSSFATVPAGSSGIGLTPTDFAATAGTQNTGYYTSYSSLIPESQRGGLFASANYRFESGLELFAELLWSKYKLNAVNQPPFLQLTTVPTSNAFNPFGANVRVSGVVRGAEGFAHLTYDEDYLRPMIGARGSFGGWQWELTALNSHDRGSFDTYGNPNATLLNAALASSDPSTALNPFVDGPMASPSLLASIYSKTSITRFNGDADIVNGFMRGPLIELPAGPMDTVLGAEYEHNTLERGIFGASREVRAAFAEARAPLLTVTDDQGGRRELLTVQVAGRYDDYNDFGSKATWQAGFEFRPFESILVRGTHATSFRPPTLYNLAAPPLGATTSLTDPRRNGEIVIVPVATGGNPDLAPTTGVSSTLGVVWSPREIPHFNVSMTGWWMNIDNAINLPNAQFIVNNDALYPGRVVRAAASPGSVGPITFVDYSYVNFGTMRQSGIDANMDWTFSTGLGDFTPAIAATYMTEFEGASTPGAEAVSRLSRANNDTIFAPRWKGAASIAWAPDAPFRLSLTGRYVGRYVDYTAPRTIGDIWYYDASLEVDLVRAFGIERSPLGGAKLLVSGTNLADTLPTYSTFFRGYDIFNYDLVGRTIFLRLQFEN